MTTYTAYFRTDADWAEKTFKAKTPKQALAKARAFHDERDGELLFQEYDGGLPVNEIEIATPEDDALAMWRDDDLHLRLAAPALLEALEFAVERLEINNHQGEEDEYIVRSRAAIASAKGAQQ
jgi:hypothetical protein